MRGSATRLEELMLISFMTKIAFCRTGDHFGITVAREPECPYCKGQLWARN